MTNRERDYIEGTVKFYRNVANEYARYERGSLHELHMQYTCVADVLTSLLKHLEEMDNRE